MRRALSLLIGLMTALATQQVCAADYRLLEIDGFRVKWGEPAYHAGAEVSYGFATARQSFPDAINCRELAPMDALAAAWGHEPARLRRLAAAAFEIWSGEANVRFRPAADGERPDILIGAQGTPRRIAFANVWHDAARAQNGIAPLTQATICFNPELPWIATGAPVGSLDLPTVLAHEIGHAIGLDHPGATGTLMGYRNQGNIDALMPGDIAGALTLYGPRPAD